MSDHDAESPEAKALWKASDYLTKTVAELEARSFSESEMDTLREMLEQDRRTRWLWSTARAWALWITAVVAGLTVGLDALKAAIKRLAQ